MGTLIAQVQDNLNYNQTKFATTKKQHLLQLILVNYRPIVNIEDGIESYLYVDAFDKEGKVYFMSRRNLKTDASGNLVNQAYGTLDEALPKLVAGRFIDELLCLSGLSLEEIKYEEDSTGSEIKFCRKNLELQALLFETQDFFGFSRAAQRSNIARFGGYMIKDTILLNGRMIERDSWFKILYSTYMVYSNIELSHYYYGNLVPPNVDFYFELNRVSIFDEFIPLIYKFTGIPNPIYDDDSIFTHSKIFSSAMEIAPLGMVGGSIFSVSRDSNDSRALYTTRVEMSNLFQISVAKMKTTQLQMSGRLPLKIGKKMVDFYSVKYFMTVLITQLIEASEYRERFAMLDLNQKIILSYTVEDIKSEDGAEWDFQNLVVNRICLGRKPEQGKRSQEISFIDALFLEYITYIFHSCDANTALRRHGVTASLDIDLKG